ncbi:MAG: sigma-70 family RNA polymerase sigma factor [Pelomonas sp.]|nr:sigma-70 family RNA polymerase sigma factor [Roseateles sp.]
MPAASSPDAAPWPSAWPAAWQEVYPELKKIARARLHAAGPQPGLNTTALVHESYLRLAQRLGRVDFASPGHFYAYAAQVMRSVIVDELRERRAGRRGGGAEPVTLDTHVAGQLVSDSDEALQVDEALQALAQVEPRLAQVVEMRYFAGMTDSEIATALGLTDRTVRRDWDKARALLRTMV